MKKTVLTPVQFNSDNLLQTTKGIEILEMKEFRKKNSLFKILLRKHKKEMKINCALCVGNEIRFE